MPQELITNRNPFEMRTRLLFLAFAAGIELQGANLHLILGTTNPHGANQYEAAIAAVKSDGTVAIRKELFGARSDTMDGLGWIDTNYESRQAVIIRSGSGDEHTGEMIVVDFDTADIAKICKKVTAGPGLGATYDYLIDHPVHGLTMAVRFHGNQLDRLVGRIVNPAVECDASTVVLENEAILHFVTDGSAGVGSNGAANGLVSGFEDYRLRTILSHDRFYFPRIPDELLTGFLPPSGSGIAVRNRRLEVFRLASFAPGSREGKFRFLLHDRIREKWRALPIGEEEYPSIRAFSDWLCWQESPAEKALLRKRPGIAPVRPGSEDFREEKSRWGKAAMYGIQNETVYNGILHIYNAATERHLKLDTKHGDSEVLLVSGDKMYYRSSDRLFEAELTADGVTRPRLIAKSELIRDAHWAFLGPATPSAPKNPMNK